MFDIKDDIVLFVPVMALGHLTFFACGSMRRKVSLSENVTAIQYFFVQDRCFSKNASL
jgi:hypothetical protein